MTVEGVEFAEKGRSLDEGDLTKRGSKPSLTMSDLTKNLTASNVGPRHQRVLLLQNKCGMILQLRKSMNKFVRVESILFY